VTIQKRATSFPEYRKVVLEYHLSVGLDSSLTSHYTIGGFIHVQYLISTIGQCPVKMNILAANIGALQKHHKNQNCPAYFDYNSTIYGNVHPK
jgi:hypothetical protein